MQYSPKLKKAMEQIKSILKENDIAGFVALHSPGYSEYLNHVQTSYSCANVVAEGVRLQLSAEKLGVAEATRLADGTFNMMTHLSRVITENALMYNECYTKLKEKWGGEDTDGAGFTSHSQQNN